MGLRFLAYLVCIDHTLVAIPSKLANESDTSLAFEAWLQEHVTNGWINGHFSKVTIQEPLSCKSQQSTQKYSRDEKSWRL